MGIFDLIPTVGEIFDFVNCRLTDHDWVEVSENTFKCSDCGKIKSK